ncbi:MAG: NUDIX hydrolase, partial [Lachnospiraceae bacterium]|nr:NUDIX hydrolase [Lachnospiraceae bacterium]
MEEFKRLSRDLVAHGAIIDYYQDTIQVPNGNIVKWDFIKHKGAAAVVPVDDKGRLIMVKQYRNALDRYTLEIPAGGLNGQEEPTMEAAARELAEETGYTAEPVEFLLTISTTGGVC